MQVWGYVPEERPPIGEIGGLKNYHTIWGNARSLWPLELRRVVGNESREAERDQPPKASWSLLK